ncbi:MAG: hypothetical protein LBQ57_03315 [Spirochaetales bacterium]|nr:hypothetical protein [Spirochaetales bacterium]
MYAGQKKIPLLISDHHADHAVWIARQTGKQSAALLVVDAHADTAINNDRETVRAFINAGNYKNADTFIKNHNWIHPLTPAPLHSLAWINKISGVPDAARLAGFLKSTAAWNLKNIKCVNLDEIDSIPVGDGALFVSIDLDFFYYENYTPRDIPYVFDRLLDYSLKWKGDVFWALCTSLAWLPGVEYAWQLLEQSLMWLIPREEFTRPEVTLFTTNRYDTSRRAESFRMTGTEPPSLYLKEAAMPDALRDLFSLLENR